MTKDKRLKYLRGSLWMFGFIFVFDVYPMMVWIGPSGWGREALHD